MALVTVQRSPSPSNSPEHAESEGDVVDEEERSPLRQRRSKSAKKRLRKFFNTIRFISKLSPCFSESYFAVKGTALILPQSECTRKVTSRAHGGDIQRHLQSMLHLLRPQDTLKVAVKLQSGYPDRNRYMAVVSCVGRQDTDECVILGIDCNSDRATIGLVLPIWSGTSIILDGDGGFIIHLEDNHHLFKPVSVQAMWSALQSLHKVVAVATSNHYYAHGLTHTWVGYYEARISSDQISITEWHLREDIYLLREVAWDTNQNAEQAQLKHKIKSTLREVMMTVDLEEVTSKYVREKSEEILGICLRSHRSYVEEEMLIILGQMDASSEVLDYLYLGSEWNASNLEELKENKIGFILNVTREIDNFFPGMFTYMNIREEDVEETDLLKYWEKTYKFINRARKNGSKVLVHCKMGVSRSASTVIAFIMKDLGWSLEETTNFVRGKRSCIKPNKSFMKQLETYQGILNASRQRHIFKSKSENNLNKDNDEYFDELTNPDGDSIFLSPPLHLTRPHSWTTKEDIAASILLQKGLSLNDGGEGPGSPIFQLGGEDADVDLSSRSTDSVEMSLPDIPSPKTVKPEDDGIQQFELELNPPGSLDDHKMRSSRKLSPFNSPLGSPQNENLFLPVPSQGVGLTLSSSVPAVFKVRHDASWIKEASPETPLSDLLVCPEGIPSKVKEHASSVPHSLLNKPVALEGEIVTDSGCCMQLQTPRPSMTNQALIFHSTPNITNQTDIDKSDDVDINYDKITIPWHSGIVKKQLQGFESRIRSGDGWDTDVQIVIDQPSGLPDLGDSVVGHGVWTPVSNENASVPKGQLTPSGELQIATGASVLGTDCARSRPVSVYEIEDIPLPIGIVQRTKQEIEEKQKPTPREWIETSFSDLDPVSKPVQRSSSLKVSTTKSQSKKLRSSERRKTCTPVLSPCNSPDTGGSVTSLDFLTNVRRELLTDSTIKRNLDPSAVQVFKYGCEEVPLELGKVRRQAQDYENLNQEIEVTQKSADQEDLGVNEMVPEPESQSIKSGLISEDSPEKHSLVSKSGQSTVMSQIIKAHTNVTVLTTVSESQKVISVNTVHSKLATVDTSCSIPLKKVESLEKTEISVAKVNVHESMPVSFDTNLKGRISPVKKVPKQSRLDKDTLFLIREIGSALLNQPIKVDDDDQDNVSKVKQIVKHIEHKTQVKAKSFLERIVIIEKETPEKESADLAETVSSISTTVLTTNSDKISPSKDCVHKTAVNVVNITTVSSAMSVGQSPPAAKPTSLFLNKDSDDIEKIASPSEEAPSDGLESIEDHLVKNLVGKFEVGREDLKKVCECKDPESKTILEICESYHGADKFVDDVSSPKEPSLPPSPNKAKPIPKSSSLEDLWTMHRVSVAVQSPIDVPSQHVESNPETCSMESNSETDPTSDTKTENTVEMRKGSPRGRPSSVILTSRHSLGTLKAPESQSKRNVHSLSSLNSVSINPHQFLPSDSNKGGLNLDGRKVRRLEGKTHPLAKLGWQHSTM